MPLFLMVLVAQNNLMPEVGPTLVLFFFSLLHMLVLGMLYFLSST